MLAEAESLFRAESATPEGERFDALATLLVSYESLHEKWPVGPLNPAALAEFRRDNGYTGDNLNLFPTAAPKAI